MFEDEYLVYDIVEIPEYIKKMTREELDREIARLEKEHLDQKRAREAEQNRKAV